MRTMDLQAGAMHSLYIQIDNDYFFDIFQCVRTTRIWVQAQLLKNGIASVAPLTHAPERLIGISPADN